jgi:nucleotide-binding universal stress UspA family protein
MKNILVPTDFSDCAQNAAQAAMLVAAKFKANIHFLHVMPNTDEGMHVPHNTKTSMANPQKGHAQNELNLLVAKATQLSLKATSLLVFDKGNERIENYIKPLEIDLIVMGSHGATGIRELVIGSNTQRVVRHSTVPVLVIKNLIKDTFKIESILFASTFVEDTAKAFNFVASFAKLWKATVHILFINFIDKITDKDTIKLVVRKLTEPYPDLVYASSSAEANDEEWGIHQFVDKIGGVDIIALTMHDKVGFLLTHSVAEDLVNHEELPVLVLNDASS